MNVETLKYFQYIAKYKNITQAAKHLYVSQSTLSRHIMSLENELGVKLFERNSKMLALTDAGKMLYADADSFINHMDSLVKNVVAAGKGQSGILKITTPKSLVHTLFDAMDICKKEYPNIKYFVESYEFSEIPLAIKYGLYDIGITYDFALVEHDDLNYITLDTDRFALIFSSRYAEENEEVMLKKLVKSLPFIVPTYADPPVLQDTLAALQNRTGLPIHSLIEVNNSDSLLLNASLGIGYGLLPQSWVDLLGPENQLSYLTLPDANSLSKVVALCKKDINSELTSTFFNLLKDKF